MSDDVSVVRLNLLRAMYLGNLVMLGVGIWPQLVGLHRAWEPLPAVTFSFWAALAALSGLGLRYPVAMVPVLLLQLTYKLVWLSAVWLPLQVAGPADAMRIDGLDLPAGMGLHVVFLVGALMDMVVIPWRMVVRRFVRSPGDRWRDRAATDAMPVPVPGRV